MLKGYEKDWELANWVRNQRLEQANLSKEGKKSRMTPERFKLLDDLGFKWSSPTPARARRNRQVATKVEDKVKDINGEEQKAVINDETAPLIKQENIIAAAIPASDAVAIDEKAVEMPEAAQAEAMTAATNVVGNMPIVEASANEENHGFLQDTIEVKAEAEETTKEGDRDTVPLENGNNVVNV